MRKFGKIVGFAGAVLWSGMFVAVSGAEPGDPQAGKVTYDSEAENPSSSAPSLVFLSLRIGVSSPTLKA